MGGPIGSYKSHSNIFSGNYLLRISLTHRMSLKTKSVNLTVAQENKSGGAMSTFVGILNGLNISVVD